VLGSARHGVAGDSAMRAVARDGSESAARALDFAGTQLRALARIVISTLALAALGVSYGRGLFGWQESGFRTPVELAVIAEGIAVIGLAAELAFSAHTSPEARTVRRA
jgi:hypothetical protein